MIRPDALAIALTVLIASPAFAQPAPAKSDAAAAGAKFSVAKSTIGELMGDPKAKAVCEKVLPELAANPDLQQGYAMTLPDIVSYVPDLTPDKLKAIDAELTKIK